MSSLAALKADQARIWGTASWALLGEAPSYFERHRTPAGVSVPRPYLLIVGRRRAG